MNLAPLWSAESPLSLLNNLEQQISSSVQRNARNASIDIVENDDAYEVTVEAVGLKTDQITIEALGKTVKITGTNASAEEQPRVPRTINYHIVLPGQVKVDEISAHLAEGLLTLTAPKVPPVEGRIVPISS